MVSGIFLNTLMQKAGERFVFQPLTGLHIGQLPAQLRNNQVYALKTGSAPIDSLQRLTRPVSPDVVRVILTAVREKQRINVCYQSLSDPAGKERLIAPHALVSADSRWHIRAFCERDRMFKDFMLHRFVSTPEIEGSRLDMAHPSNDSEWLRKVEMILAPNPALSPEQQQLVADDYAMGTVRQLRITVRAPLVKYMVVALRIGTTEQTRNNPKAHQLALVNRDVMGRLIL